ncbi:alpha beta-hydrolase isoform B [Micractinium conductrix]|nr:alpha beta-hydrolase isoform B [Micractinium conductrix]|eukprot:PSC69354.1 alpha beta-hydrolase isoform B [Micractinium conductrix]
MVAEVADGVAALKHCRVPGAEVAEVRFVPHPGEGSDAAVAERNGLIADPTAAPLLLGWQQHWDPGGAAFSIVATLPPASAPAAMVVRCERCGAYSGSLGAAALQAPESASGGTVVFVLRGGRLPVGRSAGEGGSRSGGDDQTRLHAGSGHLATGAAPHLLHGRAMQQLLAPASEAASACPTTLSLGGNTLEFAACTPVEGIGKDYELLWSLAPPGGGATRTLTLGLRAAEGGWVGLGFPAEPGRMLGATAMILKTCPACSAGANISDYFLAARSPSAVKPPGRLPVELDAAAVDNPAFPVIVAAGFLDSDEPQGGNLQYHANRGATTIDFAAGTSGGVTGDSAEVKRLKNAHAWLMVTGWGILIPIGILTARHAKRWDPLWFHVHRAVQVLGLSCALAGFIIIFSAVEQATGSSVSSYTVHRRLGISAMSLGLFQLTALLFRPHKGEKLRPYWEFVHHWVGRAAAVVATANIYEGIINVKHVGMWATVVYSIWFSAVVLLGLGLDALKLLRGRRGRGGGGDAEQAGVGGAAEPNGSAGGEGKSSGSSGEVRGGSCGDVLRATLMSALRWETPRTGSVDELVEETAAQADALDDERKVAGAGATPPGPLPDIRAFLRPVGVMEARYVRVLSSLCALTYHLDNLTPSSLLRRHRLKLVSTSKVCDMRLREPRRSADEIAAEGDAMAAHPALVAAAQAAIATGAERALATPSPAMAAVARVAPLATASVVGSPGKAALKGAAPAAAVARGAAVGSAGAEEVPGLSPVDRVTASLAAAAAAASAAAAGAYSAAVPYAGPLANNITAFTVSALTLPPVRSVAAQLQSAAAAGHSSALATVATVAAALEASWSGQSNRLPKECQSPTEWFIADDTASHTRFFVIQGSDNLDHWRVNLTFDPVAWEDPALGLKVHRGVYEAANQLYDRFLPLVQDHLASSPFAKVAFTGHSLGGSLGTLLMLMFVRRGVLPRSAVSPVYTFGAPAIFCEGGAGGACDCGAPPGVAPAGDEQPQHEAGACSAAAGTAGHSGVLGLLDLPEGAIRNVLMHKDIVPRAFACDYSLVADLLRRVSDSFKDHACLNSSRTVMFDFIGQVLVLQPPAEASYVDGEGLHPLLPPTAGLYLLRQPPALSSVGATLRADADFVQAAVANAISNLPASTAAATPGSGVVTGKQAQAALVKQLPGRQVSSAREAVWALMNAPHPLDILADPGAYGDLGAISRYHNPDNYTRALGGALRARGAWRRLAARAGETGMRYFAPVLDRSQLRASAGALPEGAASPAADGTPLLPPQAADRRSAVGGKQSLLVRMSPRRSGSAGQLA